MVRVRDKINLTGGPDFEQQGPHGPIDSVAGPKSSVGFVLQDRQPVRSGDNDHVGQPQEQAVIHDARHQ